MSTITTNPARLTLAAFALLAGLMLALPSQAAPPTPQNLAATAVSSSQINLTWNASAGATNYRVYRCTGTTCTPTTQIATPTTNSYNNTGRSANTTYRYRVRAEDGTGLSGYSNIATARTSPSLSINDVTVTEGGTASFTVSLSFGISQTVTVRASTANGTAVAPGDYTARSNVTVTFPSNTTTQTFTVTTIDDTTSESTETFFVNLTSPSSNATIADSQGQAHHGQRGWHHSRDTTHPVIPR
jgi:fibronectin type 3 domain-containing protein